MSIKIWNTYNGNCEMTLKGHTGFVYKIIQYKEDKIITFASGMDNSAKIWNIDT